MKYRIQGEDWERAFDVRRGPLGREWTFREDGAADRFPVQLERLEDGVFRFTLDGVTHRLTILPGNRPGKTQRFLLDDAYVELDVRDEFDLLEELLGGPEGQSGAEELASVMPGVIRELKVAEGDAVTLDQPLLILEAMKMENEIRSPLDGVIQKILVSPGQTVAAGQSLLIIGPAS